MRLRFVIGFAAVILIAVGSVAAALVLHQRESDNFHSKQQDEAERAARQAEAAADLSVNELAGASAFIQAETAEGLSQREFNLIAHSLLSEPILNGAAFIEKVELADRAAYERETGIVIVETAPNGGLRRATRRDVYFPITYLQARKEDSSLIGLDLGTKVDRAPLLEKARDSGQPAATGVVNLLTGGRGLVVYRAVYKVGAPRSTVAERRAALLGFVGGSFKVGTLAAAAISAVPDAVDLQLRTSNRTIAGPDGELEDSAHSAFKIADQQWVLVVRDPDRPGTLLSFALGLAGLGLAAVLGSLVWVWSRNERMNELQKEASEDPLTGLKNRRRFNEDLRLAMARARRERNLGALVMLDLDHFKLVNDTHGHQAGDQLIVEVANGLRRRTRESDTLARLGGDEFAVILPRCTVHEARLAAEGIADAIREHAPDLDGAEPITASIGIAMFGDRPRTTTDSIVSEADAAMYAAKDEGRDAIRVFDRQHAIVDEGAGS